MTSQLLSGVNAIALGLCLALVLFVPFVYVNYRRRGTLTVRHTAGFTALLIYLMALWTFTLLPLPDPDAILYAAPQLVPFQFVTDFLAYDHDSLTAVLGNPVLWQAGFNVLLFLPLGFVLARALRARFSGRRALGLATTAGFAVSLLIELTQLTGVWGIYAMPYRHFDVDDLMINTAGALCGALALHTLARVRRTVRDSRTAARMPMAGEAVRTGRRPAGPRPVTLGRRLLVMACDAIAVGVLLAAGAFGLSGISGSLAAGFAAAQWLVLALGCALTLVTGRTAGELAVRVRLTLPGDSASAPWYSPATLLPRFVRFLAGIGGYQLLGILNPAGYLLGLLGLVFVFRSTGFRGLPGIATDADLVAQEAPSDAGEAQSSRQRGADATTAAGVAG